MKTAFLLALTALGLVGCSTTNQGYSGSVGPSYATDTSVGRSMGYENDLTPRDPRGAWDNWRFGGTPDRIAPRLPTNPSNAPYPTPVIPVAPMPAPTPQP